MGVTGSVSPAITNTGQSVAYMDGAAFTARVTADYKWKGDLVQRLGLQKE